MIPLLLSLKDLLSTTDIIWSDEAVDNVGRLTIYTGFFLICACLYICKADLPKKIYNPPSNE